jgi:KTSC domain
MKRIQVESSNLASVGYDESTKTLEIQFHSGGIYEYDDVEKEIYDDLMKAESKGSYFMSMIRGAYSYNRVR